MTELIEPIKPIRPEENDENLSELRTALAAAITAVTKNKNIIVTSSDIRTWGEPEGTITFKMKKTHALYTKYDNECREYNIAKRKYDNQVGALKYGVSVEQYLEAKKKFDDYQSKKCEKAPDHELEYFIDKIINIQINEVSEDSITPELTTS